MKRYTKERIQCEHDFGVNRRLRYQCHKCSLVESSIGVQFFLEINYGDHEKIWKALGRLKDEAIVFKRNCSWPLDQGILKLDFPTE